MSYLSVSVWTRRQGVRRCGIIAIQLSILCFRCFFRDFSVGGNWWNRVLFCTG